MNPLAQATNRLKHWLNAGESVRSKLNRATRWKYISENLPPVEIDGYKDVPYQLLHRCAAAVIEAETIPSAKRCANRSSV